MPDNDVLSALHTYRVFSYSAEYDPSNDPFENGRTLLIAISSRTDVKGEEKLISKAGELFGRVEIRTHTFNPRPILISIALCLFLFDIALRKFKFIFLKKLFARLTHASDGVENVADNSGENVQNAGENGYMETSYTDFSKEYQLKEAAKVN